MKKYAVISDPCLQVHDRYRDNYAQAYLLAKKLSKENGRNYQVIEILATVEDKHE